MECLMLFQSNPQSTHSLDDLAVRLGETRENLEPVIALFKKQGIIEQLQGPGDDLYRYREPEASTEFEIGP